MASDRTEAKGAIKDQSADDPELSEALASAHSFQLKLTQETNRHLEAMHRADIGFLGRAFGGEKSAPTYIAFLVTAAGVGGAFFCWYQVMGTLTSDLATFWSTQAERALSFAAAALGFIFGRGAK